MSKIKNTDYLFLSTYLRAKEQSLLSRGRLERMADAENYNEAAGILTECGYPELADVSDGRLQEAFSRRQADFLAEIEQMCPEKKLVEAFRLKFDYHNAKVLVKAEGAGVDGAPLLSGCGRVETEKLLDAFNDGDWRALPVELASAIRTAKDTLARTANPQLTDIGLDKAYYAELLSMTKTLSDGFYTGYVRLCIDMANLRTAVRCIRGHMDEGIMRTALIDGGGIATARIARRVYGEGVTAVFTGRALAEAARLGQLAIEGAPLSAFERECDNALSRYLADAKTVSFGPAAVVAYLASLDGEIIAARMVLQGKRSGLSPASLRERLRESYV